ncbi:MAG: TRAP transporter substrate-binding protein [Peptostreptococcaceae bacterium]|nr:TRAP transporter substrate-binding protein [Peptostreptococcaceae bacterium]
MKKIISLFITLVLIISAFAGCAKSSDTDIATTTEPIKIRLASQQAEDHPQTKALYKFKELVEGESNGGMIVEVYPNCQLGAPEAYNDSLIQGAIEMALPGTVMAQSYPLAATPEMPWLFRDWDHARKALNGPEGEAIHSGIIEAVGVRCLGMMPLAFRVITSNKEIKEYDDLNGLRLRVPNIPLYIDFAKGLSGVNVISMPLTELFTALEQDVVDAQENPYATITTSKYYEVQEYILESKHIFTAHGMYINEEFYQSLSDENQQIINDASKESIDYCYDISIQAEIDAKKFLEENGIKITVPDEAFKEKLRESYDPTNFYKMYPGSKEVAEKIKMVQ